MRIRSFVAAELGAALASAVITLSVAAAPADAQAVSDTASVDSTGPTPGKVLLAQNTGGSRAQEPANGGPAENAANANNSDQPLQEVVITGLRRSIQEATDAKRNAVGVSDSIFAEDIGKFADTNIAESFNRVPGVTITRDVTGNGVNIAIRGLGTNFTKVLLNGAPVAIASTGSTDAQNTNREVDLNMFPTELFTQLTVKKTSSPDMLEGGAAGTVNMRSARPFDSPGAHLTAGAQAMSHQNAGPWGERGYLIASDTWDNGFGVLIGGVGVHDNVATPGFETIGWTNPNLSAAQCGPAAGYPTCNQEPSPSGALANAGGNWTIPATVPAGAGAGLTAGTTIDQAFLLSHNPGLSIQQIDNALLPRLGRPSLESGPMDRDNGVLSFEYRPSDNLHFYWDSMYGREHNELVREDMDWIVRNGAAIPLNEQVDNSNCAGGCVVTSGTYANSQFFLEYRPYTEDTRFWGTNPGVTWRISDLLNLDVQGNYTKSTFHREVPSVLVATPSGQGVVVNYVNNGDVPQIGTNVDLDNPANFTWNSSTRVNIQDERRKTETKGVRANFTIGKGGPVNFQVGAAYDDILRNITAFDNSQAWQNAVCGDNPNVFVPSPNTQPPCQGLSTPTPGAGYPTYPGLGTGYSAGVTTPLAYQGSLVPTGALAGYLRPGPAGFITLNWPGFAGATNYNAFHATEPLAGSSNTGASGGYVEEKTTGIYGEITGDTTVLGNELRYVAGVRWVHTSQQIGGYVSIADPRNAALADGGKYPNVLNFVTFPHSYDNTLPSFEVAYNVLPNAVVRLAASRTMTRPNPNSELPGLNFSSPSADVGTVGNTDLKPYISDNFDAAFEYYTGQEGYVAFTAFRKRVTGFTVTGNTTVPFSSLAAYGVTYDTLTPIQQGAINSRGGPTAAQVTLQEQVNASGALTINGYEIDWTQPLDFLIGRFGLNGFGWQANYTLIDQFGSGAAPATAYGVPPHTWNIIGYYDHGPVSVRLATVFYAGGPAQGGGLGQNGIPSADLYVKNYHEWDLSTIVNIGKWLGWRNDFELTVDATNLFDEKQRTYFQFSDATFTEYNPGRTWMLGFRTHF